MGAALGGPLLRARLRSVPLKQPAARAPHPRPVAASAVDNLGLREGGGQHPYHNRPQPDADDQYQYFQHHQHQHQQNQHENHQQQLHHLPLTPAPSPSPEPEHSWVIPLTPAVTEPAGSDRGPSALPVPRLSLSRVNLLGRGGGGGSGEPGANAPPLRSAGTVQTASSLPLPLPSSSASSAGPGPGLPAPLLRLEGSAGEATVAGDAAPQGPRGSAPSFSLSAPTSLDLTASISLNAALPPLPLAAPQSAASAAAAWSATAGGANAGPGSIDEPPSLRTMPLRPQSPQAQAARPQASPRNLSSSSQRPPSARDTAAAGTWPLPGLDAAWSLTPRSQAAWRALAAGGGGSRRAPTSRGPSSSGIRTSQGQLQSFSAHDLSPRIASPRGSGGGAVTPRGGSFGGGGGGSGSGGGGGGSAALYRQVSGQRGGGGVAPRERYRGILERLGRVAAERQKERRRRKGATAAAARPGNARRQQSTAWAATAMGPSSSDTDDTEGEDDEEGNGQGGTAVDALLRSASGLAGWARRWRKPLAAYAATTEGVAAGAGAGGGGGGGSRVWRRGVGGGPGGGPGGGALANAQARERDLLHAKRLRQEEAAAAALGPAEHAVWQLSSALSELTRFSCLQAVCGPRPVDSSVLAQVDARIAAMQRQDRQGGQGHSSLLPPPPPAFPLGAAVEYLDAASNGASGLEELEGVVRGMRRKLQAVLGRDTEDLRLAAAEALRELGERGGNGGNGAPSATDACCLPATSLGSLTTALPPPHQQQQQQQQYGSLAHSGRRAGSASPSRAGHYSRPTSAALVGMGQALGAGAGTGPAERPAGGANPRDGTASGPTTPVGGGGGALDSAWGLLESLVINLHDSHATRADLVSELERQNAEADAAAAAAKAARTAAVKPQEQQPTAAAAGAGAGTAASASASRASSLTPRGGALAAVAAAGGASSGPLMQLHRSRSAVDRLVALMDTTIDRSEAAQQAQQEGSPGEGGGGEGGPGQAGGTGGAGVADGGVVSGPAARNAAAVAAAAGPLLRRNVLRAAVASALEPRNTEQVVYFLTRLALLMQQDPSLPPDAGFLVALGTDLLLGEVAWLLAMLRASAGAGSPHLAALAAALRGYEGQRAHAAALEAAAERLETALEDAIDRRRRAPDTPLRAAHAERQLGTTHSMLRNAGHNVSDLAAYTRELEREVQRLQAKTELLEETIAELEGDWERVEGAHAARGAALAEGERLRAALQEALRGVAERKAAAAAEALSSLEERSVGVQVATEGACGDPRALPPALLASAPAYVPLEPSTSNRSLDLDEMYGTGHSYGWHGGRAAAAANEETSDDEEDDDDGESGGSGHGPYAVQALPAEGRPHEQRQRHGRDVAVADAAAHAQDSIPGREKAGTGHDSGASTPREARAAAVLLIPGNGGGSGLGSGTGASLSGEAKLTGDAASSETGGGTRPTSAAARANRVVFADVHDVVELY
ncbi:hypothetical protein GPECTOR_6g638 [Gonium pectorale]|uniref:Uncharacterized protein n=1 Tax=Gonium pectorale TaxID=33097 RepID=A0A150GV61_GONPE|nr:hypothetical protein GPECTOR_6g638 [Gonium pectorale]|eukprot:KXZ53721.1 hypothetical protein GPECTOR_6g638 [Gonium pectorale]